MLLRVQLIKNMIHIVVGVGKVYGEVLDSLNRRAPIKSNRILRLA